MSTTEQTDSAESITTRTDFLVPANAIPGLTEKIAKLSRRAAKLGLVAPVMTDGGHVASRMVWRRDDEGCKIEPPIVACLHAVTVTGERPVMDGWRFVACLHHVDGGTIVLGTGKAQQRCRFPRGKSEAYVAGWRQAWQDRGRLVPGGSAKAERSARKWMSEARS